MISKTGGAAFPRMSHTNCHDVMLVEEDGMTLRDYFAAKAMQGFVSQPIPELAELADPNIPLKDYVAHMSYAIADAMLEERDK